MPSIDERAKKFEKEIFDTPNGESVTRCLPFNDALKFVKYLSDYNPSMNPINPHLPEVSSYVVSVRGRKEERIVDDIKNKVDNSNFGGVDFNVSRVNSEKVVEGLKDTGYPTYGPTDKGTIHVSRNGGIKNA